MRLGELLDAEAAELAGAKRSVAPEREVTWSRGGRAFAVLSGDGSVAEFRLDEAVATAATKTPETTASQRGPGWVRFAPVDLDDHAADRAVAWLASAHRRLGPRD